MARRSAGLPCSLASYQAWNPKSAPWWDDPPTRGPGCAPSVRIRDDATAHGLSTGAARQAEINQHSRQLAMRQMSDNVRLSDTVAKQLAGAKQRKRSDRAVNHNRSCRV